jgi:preprotein translocase subunit SecD
MMYRLVSSTVFLALIFFTNTLQAQAQFSIRAASAAPVDGWQQMQVEHSDRVVWVSPTATLTKSDIKQAQPEVRADGDTVIRVVFTDSGVDKLHELTAAQFRKLIAMVVDDKVIWAPTVKYIAEAPARNNVLTGSGQHGLTRDEVDRILTSLR